MAPTNLVVRRVDGFDMTYGPRHTIEDLFGQDLQVDVEMGGQPTVCLGITEFITTPPPSPLRTRRETTYSKLTAEQARNLASQLNEAAEEGEGLG